MKMTEPRARARRLGRTLRMGAFGLLAAGGAACAAILGIDERDLIGGEAEGGDAPATEGPSDGNLPGDAVSDAAEGAVTNPDVGVARVCEPGSCAAAGGVCDPETSSCTFDCAAGCSGTKACPEGNDCRFLCNATNACNGMKCVGGRSCTFVCTANSSCRMGISCESPRCTFDCLAQGSCKDGVAIACDAGVCLANCAGRNSCNKGVTARADTYCGIRCTGAPSCAAAPLSCSSPDASIDCAPDAGSCAGVKPSCTGDYCAIRCGSEPSCADYCCDARTCAIDAPGRANLCP